MYESTEDILKAYVYKQGEPEVSEEKSQYTVRIDAGRAAVLDEMAKIFGLSKTALAVHALEAAINELFVGLPDELQEQISARLDAVQESE